MRKQIGASCLGLKLRRDAAPQPAWLAPEDFPRLVLSPSSAFLEDVVGFSRPALRRREAQGALVVAIYQSMQRVRFRTVGDYEQFRLIFAGVRDHLKALPGFLHLTWWTHPDDPTWHNEISLWTSEEALRDWHMNTYHKHAKQWAVRTGAIMEDIITNFELKSTRLIRVCPCCGHAQDAPFELHQEQRVLAQPCSQCGFAFTTMPETPNSFAVFKDVDGIVERAPRSARRVPA